jgi:hypothetical protein
MRTNRPLLETLLVILLSQSAGSGQSLPPMPLPAPLPAPPATLQAPQPTLPPGTVPPATLQAPQPTYPPLPPPLPPNGPPPPPPLFAPTDGGPGVWMPFERGFAAPPLFTDIEVTILRPSIQGQLRGSVPSILGVVFAPQSTPLNWTAMPRIELGYRLPDGQGDFSVSYRFLASEGTGTGVDSFGTFDIRSRLNLNLLDFDYGSARFTPAPRYEVKYRIGARLLSVFYDNLNSDRGASEQASNYFLGGGPHAALEVERQFGLLPAFALFGKFDGGVTVGQVQQNFRVNFDDRFGQPVELGFRQDRTQTTPMLLLQAGLSYRPPQLEFLRFSIGYQFEKIWSVGDILESTGDITSHGAFLRGEFSY